MARQLPIFRDHFYKKLCDHAHRDDPFSDIIDFRGYFQSTAAHAARELRAAAAASPAARASAVAAAAAAIFRSDWAMLRRACRTVPEIRGLVSHHGA